jgi:hypothetical protein
MTRLTLKEAEVGKPLNEKGCFTRLKEIAGASLSEIEIRLGFRTGRLAQGAYILQACELPSAQGFELIGYTHVPLDRFMTNEQYDKRKSDAIHGPHDHDKLKKNVVIPSWQLSGPNSLVKVVPVIPHTDSETYPPSSNRIGQFLITTPLRCRVAAFVPPHGHFTLR